MLADMDTKTFKRVFMDAGTSNAIAAAKAMLEMPKVKEMTGPEALKAFINYMEKYQ